MARGSWTYSGDPSTSQQDELRFLVQDTDEKVKLLSDEELTYLINKWLPIHGSLTYVASVAADNIAAKYAGVTSVSADGVTIDLSKLQDKYTALGAQLRRQFRNESIGGQIDISDLISGTTLDPGIKPLAFSMGLHDNLYAGQQDFGGEGIPTIEWNWNESGP